MERPVKKAKLDEAVFAQEQASRRLLGQLVTQRNSDTRAHLLASHSPITLRGLSRLLRHDIQFYLSGKADRKAAVGVLDCLWTIMRAMAASRIEGDTAEFERQRGEVKAVIELMGKLLILQVASVKVGALRVLSNLVRPSGTLKVRNPAFAPKEVMPCVIRSRKGFGALVGAMELDIREGRFYALRCLVALSKSFPSDVARVMGREGASAIVRFLEEMVDMKGTDSSDMDIDDPSAFTNGVGTDSHLQTHYTGGTWPQSNGDVAGYSPPSSPGLKRTSPPKANRVTNGSIAMDDIHLLAVALASELMQKGHWEMFAVPGLSYARILLRAMRTLFPAISLQDVSRDWQELSDFWEDSPDSTNRFLRHSVQSLYILCKQEPETTLNLIDGQSILALIMTMENSSRTSIRIRIGRGVGGDSLETPRAICHIFLLISRRRSVVCQANASLLRPRIIGSVAKLGASLVEDTDDAEESEIPQSYYISILRPQLIVPMLELLMLNLPVCPATLQAAIAGRAPSMLVRWWSIMNTPEYADRYKTVKVTRLESKILKILTFIVNDPVGSATYARIDPDLSKPFYLWLGTQVRMLLLGERDNDERDSDSDGTRETFSTEETDSGPSLALRALRLVSVLMTNEFSRLRLLDCGLLADVIDIQYVDTLLDGNKLEAAFESTKLLFVVLERGAEDSGVRFRMRDGEFWKGVKDEEVGESMPKGKSPFTVVHFLLVLLVVSASMCFGHSNVEHLPKGPLGRLATIMQRCMLFLCDNYGHDASVTTLLSACPFSAFGKFGSIIPSAWIQKRPTGDVVSALPVVLELVTAQSKALDLNVELDNDSPDTIILSDTRLAAARLLDALVNSGIARTQLSTARTLRRLSDALNSQDQDVSKVLIRLLARLLTASDMLQSMVERMGFSAVFEPLLEKEFRQRGDAAEFLYALGETLERHKNEIVGTLLRFLEFHSGSVVRKGGVMGEKVAVGLAYCSGEALLRHAVSGSKAVVGGEPGASDAIKSMDVLFTLALDIGFTDVADTSDAGGEAVQYFEERGIRAIYALKYLAWIKHPPLIVGLEDYSTQASAIELIDQVFVYATSPQNTTTRDEAIIFELPDDPRDADITPLSCSRGIVAAASPALEAMLYGSYAEAQQGVITIKGVDHETWNLMIGYFRLVAHKATPMLSQLHPIPSHHYQIMSLTRTQQILLLTECADRFLCEELLEGCLQWILESTTSAVRTGNGKVALMVRVWAGGWNGGSGGKLVEKIGEVARKGMIVGLREVCEGLEGD